MHSQKCSTFSFSKSNNIHLTYFISSNLTKVTIDKRLTRKRENNLNDGQSTITLTSNGKPEKPHVCHKSMGKKENTLVGKVMQSQKG